MLRVGIDIGGTFTDIAAFIDGTMFYAKAPSTPDVIEGVVQGVRQVLEQAGADPGADGVEIVHIHGTTIATNALLERRGARMGLLGTRGHQDALELGRMKRSHLYDLHMEPETPGHLAPGRVRVGIRERIDGRGRIVLPLDEDQVLHEVARLVERYRIEALAVCYLNSYANPTHERRTGEIVRAAFPDLPVSLSCEVNPVFREYERVCATALDAYVRPKVERYVRQLSAGLEGDSRLHLMQSRGGVTSAAVATRRPVTMLLSGPAAGVVAGRYAGALSGRSNLITLDVGGTSTDVALVRGGEVQLTQEGAISKYPLRIPMVALHTIGSGGGSIAWIDAGGGLHVGPESAGAMPGPACYGRGGRMPTATDASIVLGCINPAYFAGGSMTLQPERSYEVIERLGRRLGMAPREAALGVYRILVSQLADAIKLVTIRRGIDPREFCLVSFGGGGGIYASAVARELGIREVLVPRSPGTLSAFGLLVSDFEEDNVRTCFVKDAAGADPEPLEAIYRELEQDGERTLRTEGVRGLPTAHARSADMRYAGQAYEIEVPTSARPLTRAALAELVEAFHRIHRDMYGHASRARRVEIVNLRTVSAQRVPDVPAAAIGSRLPHREERATAARREAVLPDVGPVKVPVHRREALAPGARIGGPCIVEQADTTVLILPGQEGRVEDNGNLLIRC